MPVVPARRTVTAFWTASALNSGATWVMQVALFVYVLRHASPSALAAVQLTGTLPALLWMPFAGAFADRSGVRLLALTSMVVQALSLCGMALLLKSGLWAPSLLYALQGAANAVWGPARQRWLYSVVPPEGRQAANAALGSVSGTMTIVGAALGGALAAWSAGGAILAAAGLQLAAVVPLLLVRRPGARSGAGARRASLRSDVLEGFTVLRGLPLARSVIWIGIAWGFIGGAYNVLLAAYVTYQLHGSSVTLAVFYVVDGAATIIGSALAARLSTPRHLPGYAIAYGVQGAAWAAMFLPGNALFGAVLLGGMRAASGVIIALDSTILLSTVPERLRGRITSLHLTTYGGVSRLSLAVFGGILAAVGTRAVGLTTGVASVVVGAAWWFTGGRGAGALYQRALASPDAAEAAPAATGPLGKGTP
ncbi:MFS transporter [Streptomyces sp. SID486]|uniref:MFS transporter n=1 Tax=unclassified Streptomyces TaxID=2593676 RepID=UPI001370746A|nr:MFS transporter [Streptomyces sp. SID486]MYX93336.1 MFS transporter [Streptomyces sp. SID486]